MTAQIKLLTSQESFHQLHELANSRGGTVKVDKQLLTNLLIDYSVMLAALSKVSGFAIAEPRERPRLTTRAD